jgi:plasmid stabilization system protein ParE
MTVFRLNVLAKASQDAAAIVRWLTKRSSAGALHWVDAFNKALDNITSDPLRFGEAPERVRIPVPIRQVLFKTRRGKFYRAVFIVVDAEVRVLRVRGPHQRLLRKRDMPGLE